MLDQPCLGYSIQAPLAAASEALIAAQRELDSLLEAELFLTPAETFHISLHAIIPVRSEALDKERSWLSLQPLVAAELVQLGADVPAFDLEFVELRVMPSAIIALAVDASGSVAKLRARVRELTASPTHTPIHNMVHSTLAHFRSSSLLPADSVARVAATELATSVRITELRVVRELVYPSLLLEDLTRVALR